MVVCKFLKPVIASALSTALAACGGGGGTAGGGDNPPQPDTRDIFEKVADESIAQSGAKFSHEYFYLNAPVLGPPGSSIAFDCNDPPIVTEADLRSNGFGVNSNRVCLTRGTSTNCYYPGPNALRVEQTNTNSIGNTILLTGPNSGEVANFDIGNSKPGQPQVELLVQSAWTNDAGCSGASTANLTFSDITGAWAVSVYSINSFGAPAVESSGNFQCSGTSCTGSANITLIGLVEDNEASSEGIYYSGSLTAGGATFPNTRIVMSKTKQLLSILACPSGVSFSGQTLQCRYGIAERK